jgi:hypothetical protein
MRQRIIIGCALSIGTLFIAACGNSGGITPSEGGATSPLQLARIGFDAGGNAVKNGDFATGKLKPWKAFGKPPGKGEISTDEVYGSDKYSAFMGTTSPPAVNKLHGIEQKVKIPSGGTLTWWYYAGSDDETQYADDEVDLYSGKTLVYQCFKGLETNETWTEGSCDLSAYAGKTYDLTFGVNDNGYDKTYVYWYIDNVELSSSR